MLDSELRDVVWAFVESLAPREQLIAQLRFIEGLSQERVPERISATRYEVRA
ncbi:hypothetical protein [Myxococcus landrumensis]|uniref:Uncharacterized protein n=1 Tax=Myxococcus landrumensis TaxID=2813577 RepID=A0ABX7N055_9BACT|nr:hypothetical protein [Myxococcus landrumus]QSQ12092.1 hypothetical protein JY572_27435 [Myxococcus landrumus]